MTPKYCGGCSDFQYQKNRCNSPYDDIPDRNVKSTDQACQHWCEVYETIPAPASVVAMFEKPQIKM